MEIIIVANRVLLYSGILHTETIKLESIEYANVESYLDNFNNIICNSIQHIFDLILNRNVRVSPNCSHIKDPNKCTSEILNLCDYSKAQLISYLWGLLRINNLESPRILHMDALVCILKISIAYIRSITTNEAFINKDKVIYGDLTSSLLQIDLLWTSKARSEFFVYFEEMLKEFDVDRVILSKLQYLAPEILEYRYDVIGLWKTSFHIVV